MTRGEDSTPDRESFDWRTVVPPVPALAYKFLFPNHWHDRPLTDPAPDFATDPAALWLIGSFVSSDYGPAFFEVRARPAYEDGTPLDWLGYLAGEQGVTLTDSRKSFVGKAYGAAGTGMRQTDIGIVRVRMAVARVGDALFVTTAWAAEGVWPKVRQVIDVVHGSFEVVGAAAATAPAAEQPPRDPSAQPEQEAEEHATTEEPLAETMPTYFAPTAASLVVPDGWDASADATGVRLRRGGVTITIDLVVANGRAASEAAEQYAAEEARSLVGFDRTATTLLGEMPGYEATYVDADGDAAARAAYFGRHPAHAHVLLRLVVDVVRNLDAAVEVADGVVKSLTFLPTPPSPLDGLPAPFGRPQPPPAPVRAEPGERWERAQALEKQDKLDEAEQAIREGYADAPWPAVMASLYEARMRRLSAAGREKEARTAAAEAAKWMDFYAGTATSGGEGAARSLESDAFKRGLGIAD